MASSSCLLILGFAVCVGALGSTTLSQIETISLEPESSFASISLREEKRGSSDNDEPTNENENTNPTTTSTTTPVAEPIPQVVDPIPQVADPIPQTTTSDEQDEGDEAQNYDVAEPISQSLPTLYYFDFNKFQGIARDGLITKLFELAGQEYHFTKLPLTTKLKKKQGPWRNFANQLPILTHDKFKLAETVAIQIYIADKYVAGNDKLTPEERATNYMFFSFDGSLMGQVAKWSKATDAGKNNNKWKKAEKDQVKRNVQRILQSIENRLQGYKYVNKSISAGDAAVCNVASHQFLELLKLGPLPKMKKLCERYNNIVESCHRRAKSQCEASKDCAINEKTERCAPKM